jgi:hypothetical protein
VQQWRDTVQSALRIGVRKCPVTVALLLAMIVLTASRTLGPAAARTVNAIAQYRGTDLAAGRLWSLPASALLAEGWLQLAWTLVVGGALFVLVELSLGSGRTLLFLAIAHIAPTLVIAGWAEVDHPALLHNADYGTSCLIMGAAGALITSRHLARLAIATAAVFGVDALINSPVTITEHVLAVSLGLAFGWAARNRTAVSPSLRDPARFAVAAAVNAIRVARPNRDW